MRIEVYEILTTNSLSGSRIILNDNFKMLEEGLNNLYNNIDIDEETGKLSISNMDSFSTKIGREQKVCMKVDSRTGHLLLLDDNGDLALDVNKFIMENQNS